MRWTVIESNSQADAPVARYGHIAIAIDAQNPWNTELIVLHGGVTKSLAEKETFLDDVLLFHAEHEAWLRPQIKAEESPGPRAFHSAAPVENGLLFFGGQSLIPNTMARTTFNDVWYLCVENWSWRRCAEHSARQPSPRSLASAVNIGNGQIALFGGMNESSKALNDLWIFHMSQDCWESVMPIGTHPPPRIKQAMAYVDGSLWLYGGESTSGSFFDDLWTLKKREQTGQWEWMYIRTKPRPAGRSGHCLTLIRDNLLACFGGHTAGPVYMIFSQSHYYSKEFWILDPQKHKWIKHETADGRASPQERVCPVMVALSSGKIFLFGGKNSSSLLDDCWWLDLDSSETRSPSVYSLSSGTSSALPMHPLEPTSHMTNPVPERDVSGATSQPLTTSTFMGSVWNSFPSLPSRGLFSRTTSRVTPPTSQLQQSSAASTLMDHQNGPVDQEMTVINGHDGGAIDVIENGSSGMEALYSCFNIRSEGAVPSPLSTQPDGRSLDVALISYAQSSSASFSAAAHRRSLEDCIPDARRVLMNADAREFKLGNLWLLLADYKRLLLQCDVSDIWKNMSVAVRPQINSRFLHFTMETLRLSDLPELLLDYRRLVESI